MKKKSLVSVIMGSDSDLQVVSEALKILKEFSIEFKLAVLSAHRSPDRLVAYVKTAEKEGTKIFIAAAGGAAHLPGVIAAHTTKPVIGIPVKSKSLNGIDSLLSIVQMPGGVPVATVGIDGAKNAALLAVEILALEDENLSKKIIEYKLKLEKQSLAKNEKLKDLSD